MDQVTKVRKQLKLEQWKALIAECMASGMTVTSWCKANGIVEQTYYKNLKKLRELELEKEVNIIIYTTKVGRAYSPPGPSFLGLVHSGNGSAFS